MQKPKVLILDIETAPIQASVWDIWEQNIPLNMIEKDWHLLSWSAKWLGTSSHKVMYMDQRNVTNVENDRKLLDGIWKLMDEADIILTQNGKKFDIKKLNARFALNGMGPPSSFRQIDTLCIAKKYLGLTSFKLEYMTEKFNKKYKKLKHKKFPGFEMWKQCLAGNKDAWNCMEKYNKYDVLSLEELYVNTLQRWDTTINFSVYSNTPVFACNCGSTEFRKNGFKYTNLGSYQRYKCLDCGSESKDRTNVLTKVKRKSLRN